MKIFHYQDVEAKEVEEGASRLKVRWLITRYMRASNFAMRLFEMEPGGFSPFHNHPWEHEVFILQGEGTVIGEGYERKFRDGNVIFIPPNEKHQFKNSGKKDVKFLCLIPIQG